MKTTDFSLDQSNRFLSQAVSKEELNFCSFITTGLKHNLVSFQHHTLDYAWNVLAIARHVRICQFANKLKTARCELPFSLNGSMQQP